MSDLSNRGAGYHGCGDMTLLGIWGEQCQPATKGTDDLNESICRFVRKASLVRDNQCCEGPVSDEITS